MRSALPKANRLTFTQFQTFFNVTRFIDRGVPTIINFTGEEQKILANIKTAIRDSYIRSSADECHQDEDAQQRLLNGTKRATEIIMAGQPFTMCLCDFVKVKKRIRKSFITEKSPCQQVINFPTKGGHTYEEGDKEGDGERKDDTDSTSENIIPLSMAKLFSMEISVVLDETCDTEGPGVVWETARTKVFADKYITHDTYVKNFCWTFRSKSVYTFTQSPSEIVLFPPSCAKQGKADSGLRQLTMWSVHNVMSLILNSIIRDFSPTKSLDRKVALSHSVKHFLFTAAKMPLQGIGSEPKAFSLLAEALLLLECFCELFDKNVGLCLAPCNVHIPKVYKIGGSSAACTTCGGPVYGTAFHRMTDDKEEIICFDCLSRLSDKETNFVEHVFLDDLISMTSDPEDESSFAEFLEGVKYRFSEVPQFKEILMLAENILPPLSDTFYLNHKMRPRCPYLMTTIETSTQDRNRIWNDWDSYFKEQIATNKTITKRLRAIEKMYKPCLPAERFYTAPIRFCLFLFHASQEGDVDSLIEAFSSVNNAHPCVYSKFIIKVLECSSAKKFKVSERDMITTKLLESSRLPSDTKTLSLNNSVSVVLNKDELSKLQVFQDNAKKKTKRKIVREVTRTETPITRTSKINKRNHVALDKYVEVEEEEEEEEEEWRFIGREDMLLSEPLLKRIASHTSLSFSFYPTKFSSEWLTKYVTTNLFFGKKAIQQIEKAKQSPQNHIKFAEEEYTVDSNFVVQMRAFVVDTKKSDECLKKYERNLLFLSMVHMALSETMTKVSSFKVLPVVPRHVHFKNSEISAEEDNMFIFKKWLKEKHVKYADDDDDDECPDDKEEFSLDLFYKLLRTRNSDSGRPLLLDIFSSKNKDKYGWVLLGGTSLPPLPYKKVLQADDQPVDIFGFGPM